MTPPNDQPAPAHSAPFRSNRIWMAVSALLLVVLLIYIFANPPGAERSDTVAKVNGVKITKDQLYDALAASGGAQVLSQMIDTELVRQEAEKAGIKVTDADIEEELAYTKSLFGSDEEFEYAMMMYGTTLEQLKDNMYLNVQIRKILEPQVTVTDDEIQAYYAENLDIYKTPEQVKASHIVLATREEAEAVRASLAGGADFAALAAEKSIDEATKDSGGELELFARGEREEVFEDALFALEVGKLSEVIESSEGFHVIKLAERHAEVVPGLDELEEEIKETLISDKINERSAVWIEELYAASDIENTFEAE